MSLYRNFLSVGALTLLSRVVGFVRDALMAAVLGTGLAADAFFAAFRFPNLFRRLFAEGAFNTAFVPMFAGTLEREGMVPARLLAGRIMSWLVAVVLAVTLVFELFMPQILVPFVPGFLDDPEKFELTVFLTRLMFPYLACMSLMAAYAAILNSLNRFFAAAFAPVLLNLVNIAALAPLALLSFSNPSDAAAIVAVAVLIGGVAQVALVYGAIRRAGVVPRLGLPRLDPEVRRFWALAVPAILTGGITQINIFVGTIIASGADGAISTLNYADRLYQLPLGIIGIAIGTVLLPELSRHIGAKRDAEARTSQSQALLLSMLLSVPAATALIALAVPIVRVLFERGAFGVEATQDTAEALVAFAAGLPAFVLIRVLQPGFFARGDTRTPTVFAALSVVINITLSLFLFPTLVHVGIAIATSVSAWANAALLGLWLARRGHFTLRPAEWVRHGGVVGLAIGMALLLWALSLALGPVFAPGAGFLGQLIALFGLIGLGIALYFGAAHLTGVQPLGALLRRFAKRRA